MSKFDLEDRLVDFAVLIIGIAESMPKSTAGGILSKQIIRSATSSALNYGEAQSGESRRDFVHKIKVVLKELRETGVSLKIIHKTNNFKNEEQVLAAKKEMNELISIFIKSVVTAQRNMNI